jgi:hypothetical protein
MSWMIPGMIPQAFFLLMIISTTVGLAKDKGFNAAMLKVLMTRKGRFAN